jgi:hypothetical protein
MKKAEIEIGVEYAIVPRYRQKPRGQEAAKATVVAIDQTRTYVPSGYYRERMANDGVLVRFDRPMRRNYMDSFVDAAGGTGDGHAKTEFVVTAREIIERWADREARLAEWARIDDRNQRKADEAAAAFAPEYAELRAKFDTLGLSLSLLPLTTQMGVHGEVITGLNKYGRVNVTVDALLGLIDRAASAEPKI